MIRSAIFVALLVIVFCVVGRVSGQNLVVNPGFESGDFSPGWTYSPSPNGGLTSVDFVNPHTGTYAVRGEQLGEFDSISQNLSTVVGQSYDLSFWLASSDAGGPGTTLELRVWWNGAIVLDRTNDPVQFGYTQVFLPNLVASSSSTALRFDIRNDPGAYFLDDVSVIATQRIKTLSKVGTTVTITIDSFTNYSYQLQQSSSPDSGSFTNLGTLQNGTTGTTLTFTDTSASGTIGFYRVVIVFEGTP